MSVRFDASADGLFRTASPLPPVASFTMMGWFKLTANHADYSGFLEFGQSTGSTVYVGGKNNSDLNLFCWNGSSLVPASPSDFLVLDEWRHFAITVSGTGSGQFLVYRDGVLRITNDGNASITGDIFKVANNFGGGTPAWFEGSACAVKVWSGVLSAAEIAAEMDSYTPVRTAGLYAWYPMRDVAEAVTDFSDNGYDLTATGTLTTDADEPSGIEPLVQAYRFDGSADMLTVSGALPDPAVFTWMSWIYFIDNENYNCLFDWGLTEGTVPGEFAAIVIDGGGVFPVPFGNNALILNTGGTYGGGSIITPNAWHHVAYVKNGSSHTVYLDGVVDATATEATTLPPSGTLNFGNNPFSEFLDGRMGGIKLWSAALSAVEIAAEMAQYVPVRAADLYAWWSGDVLDEYTDLSGNGHTLIESGTVTVEAGPPIPYGDSGSFGTSNGVATAFAFSPSTGIIDVPAGGNLQAAINAAVDGDEIRLEAGATFTGNFTIPARSPSIGTVVIKTAGTIPDRRILPSDASALATIYSGNNDPAIEIAAAAAGWTFQGVQVLGGIQEVIICLKPSRIFFDRVLIIGNVLGSKRGIRGNGTYITVHRCHISNIWLSDADTQAFCAWDGAGPYTLTDNYFEASGENTMFGGSDSASLADMPADITVEDNHYFKRLSWLTDTPTRLVKNIFELKVGKRVTVRRNRFENNWTSGQPGWGIVFTPRNQENTAPWSCIEDVLFEDNIVISEKGFNFIGYDDLVASGRCQRVTIRNCLVKTELAAMQITGEMLDLTIDHVTFANAADRILTFDFGDVWPSPDVAPRPALYAVSNLIWTNCVMSHRDYGIFASGDGQGTTALNYATAAAPTGYAFTNNAVAAPPVAYPTGTLTPAQATHDAQFANTVTYPLVSGSIYEGVGTGGSDLGWQEDAETGGIVSATGAALGIATADATGALRAATVGTASGVATAVGVAGSLTGSVGVSNGRATVVGRSTAGGVWPGPVPEADEPSLDWMIQAYVLANGLPGQTAQAAKLQLLEEAKAWYALVHPGQFAYINDKLRAYLLDLAP